MVTFAPCFCAGTVEYDSTLPHRTRRKTRHCLILHPPFAIKMFYVFLTNYNVEVIFYKYHKKFVHRNFYVCFTKFGTLFFYFALYIISPRHIVISGRFVPRSKTAISPRLPGSSTPRSVKPKRAAGLQLTARAALVSER